MRRRTLRPNSRHALVFITMVLAAVIWIGLELGRTHVGRTLLLAASIGVFAFFAIGWTTR